MSSFDFMVWKLIISALATRKQSSTIYTALLTNESVLHYINEVSSDFILPFLFFPSFSHLQLLILDFLLFDIAETYHFKHITLKPY